MDPPNRIAALAVRYEALLNKTVTLYGWRWVFFGLLFISFSFRVLYYQQFYVVAYGLGIFLLNAFLAFLSPRSDPELEGLANDASLDMEISNLPQSAGDEFKPFNRRLPEFTFWYLCIRAALLGTFLTLFEVFDLPVFWPVLLFYFLILFVLTMKRQIQHMIKFRYIPFNLNKARYDPTTAK